MPNTNFDDLTFSNDFIFCKVLQNNPDLCKELLELILNEEIPDLDIEIQKPIEITSNNHGVRFDVFSKSSNSIVFDVEMQNARIDNIPKRARYSQSLIDLELLEKGKRYCDLHRSLVIIICNFKLFKEHELHKYSFKRICIENKTIELGDETEMIFICTKGKANDISDEFKKLLEYISGNGASNDFTNRIEKAVSIAKRNPIWRKEYMFFQDYIDIAAKDGYEKGKAEEKARAEREKARADAAEAEIASLKAEIAALKNT